MPALRRSSVKGMLEFMFGRFLAGPAPRPARAVPHPASSPPGRALPFTLRVPRHVRAARRAYAEMTRAISVTLLSLLALLACHREGEWRTLGGSEKASFVVVFKDTATAKEILRFIEGRLSVESPKGFWPLAGIGAIVKVSVEGHEAYGVYMPAASSEERRVVRERILAEPSVLAVFEEVVPEQVKLGASTAGQGREGRHATSNGPH